MSGGSPGRLIRSFPPAPKGPVPGPLWLPLCPQTAESPSVLSVDLGPSRAGRRPGRRDWVAPVVFLGARPGGCAGGALRVGLGSRCPQQGHEACGRAGTEAGRLEVRAGGRALTGYLHVGHCPPQCAGPRGRGGGGGRPSRTPTGQELRVGVAARTGRGPHSGSKRTPLGPKQCLPALFLLLIHVPLLNIKIMSPLTSRKDSEGMFGLQTNGNNGKGAALLK